MNGKKKKKITNSLIHPGGERHLCSHRFQDAYKNKFQGPYKNI